MTATVNAEELEAKVRDAYRHVAKPPQDRFHFELGAAVALRAEYDADRLSAVPTGAVESFAGVGFFDLASLQASDQARNASAKYGVKSISLLATKTG